MSKKKYIASIILAISTFAVFEYANGNNINKNNSKNNLVCIDPGHQIKGNNKLEEIAPNSTIRKSKVSSGTRGVATKKYEYQLVLEVGLKLRDKLIKNGYDVFMVRDKNEVNISNKERAIMTNNKGCTVYIRIHADGSSNSSVNGASVLTSSTKNIHTKSVQARSEKFSRDILSEYIKSTGAKNRGVLYRDDLTGTNWSKTVNTLIELGFMSNPEEDRKMSTEVYQNKMVQGIYNGIEKYFREFR